MTNHDELRTLDAQDRLQRSWLLAGIGLLWILFFSPVRAVHPPWTAVAFDLVAVGLGVMARRALTTLAPLSHWRQEAGSTRGSLCDAPTVLGGAMLLWDIWSLIVPMN